MMLEEAKRNSVTLMMEMLCQCMNSGVNLTWQSEPSTVHPFGERSPQCPRVESTVYKAENHDQAQTGSVRRIDREDVAATICPPILWMNSFQVVFRARSGDGSMPSLRRFPALSKNSMGRRHNRSTPAHRSTTCTRVGSTCNERVRPQLASGWRSGGASGDRMPAISVPRHELFGFS
jgi:hypothetical protein